MLKKRLTLLQFAVVLSALSPVVDGQYCTCDQYLLSPSPFSLGFFKLWKLIKFVIVEISGPIT